MIEQEPRPIKDNREDVRTVLPDTSLTEVGAATLISDVDNESELQSYAPITDAEKPEASRVGWIRRNVANIALGALVIGGVTELVVESPTALVHEIGHEAKWAVPAALGTEVVWWIGAGAMAAGAGSKIGNPLKLRQRFDEFKTAANKNALYRSGLVINTTGAVAFAGVIAAGASQLPESLWPGAALFVAADLASTVAIRAPLYASKAKTDRETEKAGSPERNKVKVRHAQIEDMSDLASLDLKLFNSAYGDSAPAHDEVEQVLTSRYLNSPDYMFVAEMGGKIAGFVSAFRTNVEVEDFVSWEQSTSSGTLDGKVDPNGKYVYVTNMTIEHQAVRSGAEDMLLANLFANGIRDKIEYGYFVSRMPRFGRWLRKSGIDKVSLNEDELLELANSYMETRNKRGERIDPQLRMYENYGFKLGRVVANGFQDKASLDFAVTCKADVPPKRKIFGIIPGRHALSIGLRQLAKYPKVLEKALS